DYYCGSHGTGVTWLF
nr:immunoglobulin light chain junction region [Macaca mulatta]MOV96235.1 immunoglobulin light chain junction region [Macaca mulatta]MOV96414.1 immunoglobulin light chain junction region [Macaca mulatta]MOV96533.1 immunoglobulin light chain junction region [Macaca mulatta]MOV96690.1 immunoglobulin light chain junction region [Macaca mulatta]